MTGDGSSPGVSCLGRRGVVGWGAVIFDVDRIFGWDFAMCNRIWSIEFECQVW